MPEQPPSPQKEIIELCGVLGAEQAPSDAGIRLSVTTIALGVGPVELTVGDGQMAVLRYAGHRVAPPAAGGDVHVVKDDDEYLEFVGGSRDELPDGCFRLPGRKGGLAALNQRRVEVEAAYTAGESEKLQRLREKGVRTTRLSPVMWERVSRTAIERQTMVVDRLAALASVDVVLGTVDRDTARQRALIPPLEPEEPDEPDPEPVADQTIQAT